MDSPTATLIGILQDRVESLRNAGNLKEALHAASAAVEKSQQTGIPVIDLDGTIIVGFDRAKIDQALKDKKLV